MDSQNITSGRDVTNVNAHEVAAPFAVGHDIKQTVTNNFYIVAQALTLGQHEGLLPKSNNTEMLNALVDAVEKGSTDNSTVVGVSFAGEVLKDALIQWPPEDPDKVYPLRRLVPLLAQPIGEKLTQTGHWEDSAQRDSKLEAWVLWLEATNTLWRKNFGGYINFHIRQSGDTVGKMSYGFCDALYRSPLSELQKSGAIYRQVDFRAMTPKNLRVFVTGIVLDLIGVGAEAVAGTQFRQKLIDFAIKP